MNFEQWLLNYNATHPAPVLTSDQMLIGAVAMGVCVFLAVSLAGDVVSIFSKRAGGCLILLSLPAGGLFALVAWGIMVSG